MATPQPIAHAAATLSFGVVLVVLSAALLLTSAYLGLTTPSSAEGNGSVPLAVVGWIILVIGLPLLRVGIYRLVDHADDAAVQREHRRADG
ncbi:hypothetical protein [Cellulomonas sp. Leaf334]|uniref:hypothetical protein n=1 Tax=Cellulomonas sp. Leaf334 TaxID=1736339 RepID=UPI0012E116DC|nr:hypothetical protein [Cellulomonas sp. Leaf334]